MNSLSLNSHVISFLKDVFHHSSSNDTGSVHSRFLFDSSRRRIFISQPINII